MKRGTFDPSEHIDSNGRLAVRVTAGAASARLVPGDPMRVAVTVVAEGGKANKAVIALLARALGLPKSAVILIRGDTNRDKLFQIDVGT